MLYRKFPRRNTFTEGAPKKGLSSIARKGGFPEEGTGRQREVTSRGKKKSGGSFKEGEKKKSRKKGGEERPYGHQKRGWKKTEKKLIESRGECIHSTSYRGLCEKKFSFGILFEE